MADSPEIVKVVTIRATPEALFAFFTDPAKMTQWIGTAVELDARPGGVFRIVPNRADVIRGRYLEVTPPSRVVFTWGFEGEGQGLPPGASVVEITLRPVDGGTEVRLVHRALPDGIREAHAAGWSHYIARITVAAEGGAAGPDPLADPNIRHGASDGPARTTPRGAA
jgi:uncharacterized protein YndB with AHSA1/START domain